MAGGNANWKSFLQEYGISSSTPIEQKYSSPIAEAYREKITCAVEGKTWRPPSKASLKQNNSSNNGNNDSDNFDNDWDDWGESNNQKKKPIQYSSASNGAKLNKYESSRSISSDSFFNGDEDDFSHSNKQNNSSDATEYLSAFGDGLAKLGSSVAETVSTTVKAAGQKIDEAKPAEMLTSTSQTVSGAAASGWSSVTSFWGKARETVMTSSVVKNLTEPGETPTNTQNTSETVPKRHNIADDTDRHQSAPARPTTSSRLMPDDDEEDDAPSLLAQSADERAFARQLAEAEKQAAELSAKRAQRVNQTTSKRQPVVKPKQSSNDGDFFAGFGDDDDAPEEETHARSTGAAVSKAAPAVAEEDGWGWGEGVEDGAGDGDWGW
eukprot:CAMPEP_0168604410 /NCGR_PEP_ID=MMETSP0420-20121227/15282_1 /TAXON_ID=498008 /ORGANISM="Pessonella sp." /LENGTH=379 /DNA_ID=CAMNT_0008643525 /DNA_START=230 /DNA_END=1369 /DNA_ORIENTATION=-